MWTSASTRALIMTLTCVTMMLRHVRGHGRMWEPPSRSTMWRIGYNTPPNYDDNTLSCGGMQVHYGQNGGKCGVCGDPFNGPLDNEPGGKYARGLVVRKYDIGGLIDIVIQLTANHKGYFEFSVCPKDDPGQKDTHACFDQNKLMVVPGGSSRYHLAPADIDNLTITVRLPISVACEACTLRWKYNAGNNFGTSSNGTGCLGCGNQDQFYACADIAVGYDVQLAKPTPSGTPVDPNKPFDGYTKIVQVPFEKTTLFCTAATYLSRNIVWWLIIIHLFTTNLVWSPVS